MQSVRAFVLYAEGWVFEFRPRQTGVVIKGTGSASSSIKRSAVGVSRVLGDDHIKKK